MKNFLILALCVGFLVVGCSDDDKKSSGFMSNLGDCNAVFNNCYKECPGQGRECIDKCEQARGMCNSMAVRRCMQGCVDQYGRGSSSAETCKNNCTLQRQQ